MPALGVKPFSTFIAVVTIQSAGPRGCAAGPLPASWATWSATESQTNATNADPLDLENFSAMQEHLQDLHGSYCETKTGKEISCDDESLETVVVWTDNAEMALSQICALWPSQANVGHHGTSE